MKGYFQYGTEVRWGGESSIPKMMDRDCAVEVCCKLNGKKYTGTAGMFDWSMVTSYKVIDERYKPAEKDSTWFERGELPPAGIECEMLTCGNWIVVFIIGIDNETKRLVVRYKNSGKYFGHTPEGHLYRPIRTEREKAIDAAAKIAEEHNKSGAKEFYGALYDAGLLRLPEGK